MRASHVTLTAVLAAASFLAGCTRNLVDHAKQLEAQGNHAAAVDAYERALAGTPAMPGQQRSEVLTRIGDCLYAMDQLPDAYSSYQKAVEADPKNARAHFRLGELLLAAGAPERAREQAMQAIGTMGNSPDVLSLLASAWAATDNPLLAKQAYERVLQADPKRVKDAIALADIYNREDDTAKAREVLKQAAVAQPQSAMPLLARARLEEQEGNGPAAEDSYRKAVSVEDTPETNFRLAQFLERAARITEAEQVLRKVDSQTGRRPIALGDFQLASGRAADALEQYQNAANSTQSAEPNANTKRFWHRQQPVVPAKSEERASVMGRLIEAQIQSLPTDDAKKRDEAIKDIRKKVDGSRSLLDPATTAILNAELALADGNVSLARLFASSAVDLAPESAAALYIAGCVEDARSEPDKAEVDWQSAIDADAHFAPARLALAEVALDRKDGVAADKQARQVVRDDPGNFRALVVFARALLMQSKPTAAAVMAERAAALDPTSETPALLIGEVALQLDRMPEALMSFEHAVIAHPESEEAMDGLMRVYRRGTVSYASVQKMERVAVEPPASSTLLEISGRLYADHGWYKEAIRALQKTIELDPKRLTAVRLLAQLQWSTGDISKATEAASKVGGKSESLLAAYKAQQAGNSTEAISKYERALRDGDNTGVAANNLAWLYAEHGVQLDRALELAEAAAKASPNNPAVLDTFGYVLLKRREYTAAVKALETAAKLSTMKSVGVEPEVAAQIRKHLSDAYYAAGQTEAAFQIAQNRGPFAAK